MDIPQDNDTTVVKSPAQAGLTFIEQLQNFATQDCIKSNRPYLVGVSEVDRIAILCRPPCKMWNCPACAARNASRWIARIINHVNIYDANNWKMFTLTAHEKWRGRERSVLNLRQGWKKLYNRIKYEYQVEYYARVWESHKDGSFHLHGLIDTAQMSKRWLKNNARETGMGYQVDLSQIDNAGQVAGYIAKYFLKSEVVGEYPKNLRRIEVSRNWTKLPDLKAATLLDWYIQQTRDGQIARAQSFYNRGFDIIDNLKRTE